MRSSLLLGSLIAATAVTADLLPPDATRYNVKLIAHVPHTAADISPPVEGRVVDFYHVGAGEAYAVLGAPGPRQGLVVYQNGTGYDDREYGARTQFDGGSAHPPTPYGMQVLKSGVVTLNPGRGTTGVQQRYFPQTAGQWVGPGDGAWYACYRDLPFGGDFAQLLWRRRRQPTPDGCVDVHLFPQCVVRPALAKEHKTDMPLGCWNDVEKALAECGKDCPGY
jgi:hypothetical protein